MSNIMEITVLGFLIGIIGTGTGGSIAFLLNRPSSRFLSGIIGFSSGLMIAIVAFELLPEAYVIAGVPGTVFGMGLGAAIASTFEGTIERIKGKNVSAKDSYVKTALLMGIAIALHNFPEGLAIGSGFMAQRRLGLGLAIVVALHNIPEGVAMVTPMRVGGITKLRAFALTLLAGAPMGVGAYLGAMIGSVARDFIGLCLAFAGGTMLYITFGDLVPKGKELDKSNVSTLCAIFGFILGMLISNRF